MLPRNRFTWDPYKALINLRDHRVSFEEAWEVFNDAYAIISDDTDHDEIEERWKIIGQSRRNRTLFVVFCEREQRGGKMTYRIISARKTEQDEREEYENGYK